MRLNPDAGTIQYCNAGHPPAFLLHPGGALRTLDSTAMMLGPLSGQELEPEEAALPLAPGDLLFAYTDGAFESTNTAGVQLGIDGLRRSVLSAAGNDRDPDHLVSAIDQTVRTHRDGPAQDDTLLLAIEILKP
jgi:serine phosphatase RsbU (regulator of sigma subunit)